MWYSPVAAKADCGGPPRERGRNDVGRIAAPKGAAFAAGSGARVQEPPQDPVDCVPWAWLRWIAHRSARSEGRPVPETSTNGLREMLAHLPSKPVIYCSLNRGGTQRA